MDARSEYVARLEQRRNAAALLERRFRTIGNVRLLVGLSAVAVGWFVFGQLTLSPWWLLLPGIAFTVLVVMHSRVVARLQRARRAVTFYERALARVEDRWSGIGETGERFRDPNHVYAEDLDLFGKGSLFQLLCTVRTRGGEDTLANWLLTPAGPDEVLARQNAIEELRANVNLREALASAGDDVRADVNAEALAKWAERPVVVVPIWTRIALATLAAATIMSGLLYLTSVWPRTPFLFLLVVEALVAFAYRPRILTIIANVEAPARDLALIAVMLGIVEEQKFESPFLGRLRTHIQSRDVAASASISQLRRLISFLDWRRHQLFAPIALILLWGTQLGLALEKWRERNGQSVRLWLQAVAEFEAICALSAYSYERPENPFPILSAERGYFDAEALGHPLLPRAQCIPNNLRIGGDLRLLIISGSNMSGKSTLLRAIGLNTVLAWAGAPVCAARLTVSPLSLGASIRVSDSLQDGRSRFYAEITRLRQIVDLTNGPRMLLFLIDEMLSGTNSHDRRIGAEAIVRGLVERGAIGLITTHDLALAHIAETLHGRAINAHFEDTLEGGEIHFDYQLHPGIVNRSNALELMRSVGLEV